MNRTNRRRHRVVIAVVGLLLAMALIAIGRARPADARMDALPSALP